MLPVPNKTLEFALYTGSNLLTKNNKKATF